MVKCLLVPVEVPSVSGRGRSVAARCPRWLGSLKDGEPGPPSPPRLLPGLPQVTTRVGKHQHGGASSEPAKKFHSFPRKHCESRRSSTLRKLAYKLSLTGG